MVATLGRIHHDHLLLPLVIISHGQLLPTFIDLGPFIAPAGLHLDYLLLLLLQLIGELAPGHVCRAPILEYLFLLLGAVLQMIVSLLFHECGVIHTLCQGNVTLEFVAQATLVHIDAG